MEFVYVKSTHLAILSKDFTHSLEQFIEIFLLPSLICIVAFIKLYFYIY